MKERTRLHPGQLREQHSETDTPRTQHRVHFHEILGASEEVLLLSDLLERLVDLVESVQVLKPDLELRQFPEEFLMVGEKLVERWVQETDHNWQPVHCPKEPFEIATLKGEKPIEGVVTLHVVPSHDHLPHHWESILLEEHMLRAAEPDPLCPHIAGAARIIRVIRICPHLQPPEFIRPTKQFVEPGVLEVGDDSRQGAQVNFTANPIDGDLRTFTNRKVSDPRLAVDQIDLQSLHPHDGRLAELARNQRSMAGPSPSAGDDALRC